MSSSVLGSLYQLPPDFFLSARAGTGAGEKAPAAEENDLRAALHSSQASSSQEQAAISLQGAWREAGATCTACGIGINSPGFVTAAEQRAHFKTDWHRYNVKRRLHKQPPLPEEEFEQLLEGDSSEVSSISGSEGSEDSADESGSRQRPKANDVPRAMFTSQDGRPFCVWQCLVHRDHVRSHQSEEPSAAQQLAALQQLRTNPGLFVVILLRGGHFAAAVFRPKPASSGPRQQGDTRPAAVSGSSTATSGLAGTSSGAGAASRAADTLEVVAHKTFHRYVVRAKAGGKQSAKDASGKYARSAGAALRRYNEAALDRDIADLLTAWQQYLEQASLIFVQAPASNARSVFTPADMTGPVLPTDASRGTSLTAAGAGASRSLVSPADPRVRRIPFATQRPTFTEARRVVGLLLAVFEPTAAALAAQQAAQEAEEAAEEVRLQRRQQRKARKAVAAATAGANGGVSSAAAAVDAEADAQDPAGAAAQQLKEMPLHAAARGGDHRLVSQLLSQGEDPTIRDCRGRTSYAVAADKDVRDAFRRYMAAAPGQWDWAAAGVPSPLTDELQAAQAQKKAEKRARQKEREKERKAVSEEERQAAAKAAVDNEIARAAAEAAALAVKLNIAGGKATAAGKKVGAPIGGGGSRAGGQRLGGGPSAAGQRAGPATAAAAPLSAEEMARRREQMAAAAEARMKALQQASSQQRLY